jgi:hypothetical protein
MANLQSFIAPPRTSRALIVLGLATLIGAAAAPCRAIDITLTPPGTNSSLLSTVEFVPTQDSKPLSLTDGTSLSTSISKDGNTASADYSITNTAAEALISFSSQAYYHGGLGNSASFLTLHFTLGETVTYDLSGSYSGSLDSPGEEGLYVRLSTASLSQTYYDHGVDATNNSGSSASYSDLLQNSGASSLTGILGPGSYWFYIDGNISNNFNLSSGGSISTSTALKLTKVNASSVPDTARTQWLLVLGLVSLGVFAARRRCVALS